MTRTPSRTRTRTTRSSEHAARRPLMHSGLTSHLWLKVPPCVSFHVIHACAPVCCSLSVSPHPSFYFLVLFLFQLYLMSNSAPDEFSIEDPLCNSSLGSMVTLDYVTPLTHTEGRTASHHKTRVRTRTRATTRAHDLVSHSLTGTGDARAARWHVVTRLHYTCVRSVAVSFAFLHLPDRPAQVSTARVGTRPGRTAAPGLRA